MSYFEKTKITNSTGTAVNPAEDETIVLLRRLVKLLESNAVVDIQNKQKITLDTITNGVSLGTNVALLGGGNGPTPSAPVNIAAIYQPVWIGPVDQRFQIIDAARLTYDNGIRSHLTFT